MKKIVFSSLFFISLLFGQSYVLDFDGSNDYLSVSAANNASTKLDGQFTVSAWVFIEGANKQQIFYNDGGELEWLGAAYNYFRVQPGAVNSVTNLHRYQWHHVVMTRNSSNSIQIYVNGDLSQYYVSNSDARDDILYIGRDPEQGEYFDGSMDEIAIWSTELSATQINTLYNKGVPESATNISGAASSLQSYWKLEQSTGTTAANSVTNGAALTLNNGPTWGKFKQSPVPEIMYNIRTGSNSSYPENFIKYNEKIYFKADDGSKGSEMWVFDPANDAGSSNPQRISDIRSGSGSGISWTDHWLVWNNKLYFVGNDGSYGDELYSYDGSSFTRITDIYSGSNSSSPNYFTLYNDKLYFSAYNSTYGTELYVYDGTNVSLVADNASGSESGFGYGGMKVYKDKLYFQGYSATVGYELYAYDGTSISLVKDISLGTSSKIQGSINNSNIAINARGATGETNRPANDMHHSRSNASLSNSINPGMSTSGSSSYVNSSYPSNFTVYNDKLFFNAQNTTIGGELFYYDGTDVTGIDIYTGSTTSGDYTYLNNSNPYSFTVYKSVLYFQASEATYGTELWGYDATNGARLIKDISPGSSTSGSSTYKNNSYPSNLTVFDNKLYFSAEDGYSNSTGSTGGELWYYDENNAGRAADIYPGTRGSYPYSFYATNDKMYFRAQASSTGSEPYVLTSLDPWPSIASVTSTTSNGTYKAGDAINITVNFSEAVSLSNGGSMTVTLETGSTDQTVKIESISNATSASGTYTVVAGDVSSDLNVKSITMSGTLSDNSGQIMEDYSIGSNLSSSKAIVVDGLNPAVASIKSTSTNTTYGTGAEINITVNFSEKVTLSSSGSMTVTLETGSTNEDGTVSITSISSDSSASGTYTVRDGDASNDLSVNSIALSSGATLKDAVGNVMSDFSVPADSNLSDFNAIIINTTKPSTPLGFVVSSNYGSVGLAWIEISGATYKIYRSTSTSDFASVGAPSTNSYTDTPSEVKRYYYYATSVNNLGESSPSDTLHGYPSKIWYVEMDGLGVPNDNAHPEYGKSKAYAFKTIEQAVKTNNSLVSGDTIYVGPSISSSKPTKSTGYYDFGGNKGNINLDHSKDFVLVGTAGADSTILNAEGDDTDPGDLSGRHFYFDDGQSNATQIIGLTFFNGRVHNNWPGGGSLVLDRSTNIQFVNCVFDSNRVTDNNAGGAIDIRGQATPSFTGCTFINNYIEDLDGEANGGAIRIESANSTTDLANAINFKQTKFIGNYAKAKNQGNGGAVNTSRNTVFENCLFIKNGAIGGFGASTNTYENARGGAIYSVGGYESTGVITVVANSTFDSNYVDVRTNSGNPSATDIFYGWGSSNQSQKAYVFNTIITGSYRLRGGADYTEQEKDKIFYSDDDKNKLYVNYSAIEGSASQSWADDNVFDINPVYNNPSVLDYSLSSLSPVLGQGTSSFESFSAPSIDILGAARPSSNPDMGAYENTLTSSNAPLPVTGLTGAAKTNSAYLSWPAVKSSLASTSNAENIKYLIYQGDSQVGTSTSTSHTVTKLTNGTIYTFSVGAQDTSSALTGAPSKAVLVTPVYSGPYWYVASSGGTAAGTSNSDLGSKTVPLNHMSSAIESAAAGDTIVMMKGTHTGSNNRGIDWNASKALVIMGDPDYVADSTIIDAGAKDRHFKFNSGEDTTYQVIGLTLYNGKTTDNNGGGSVFMSNNSSPVFRKVIFKQNVNLAESWEGGGAVSTQYSRPSFYYCIFDGNTLQQTGDIQNEANGGAVWIRNSSTSASQFVLFDGCTFKNNVAKGKWGARGGAIRTHEAQVIITNSLFYGNMTFANSDGTNTNSSSGGAIDITAPAYYDNSQNTYVGGQVKIINSTIANNLTKTGNASSMATSGSGVYFDTWGRSEKAWFFNNIVWGNKTSSGDSWQQVYFPNESGWGSTYLNYNVVQSSDDISFQDDDSFETDPTFSDSTNGDYSLSNASSLIGKGGSSYEGVSAPTTDLLGLSRPNPSGSNPDIGAYENSLSTTPYPGQIKNLTAVGGSGSVTLNWDAVADADSAYKVYKRDGAAFSVAAAYYLDKTTETTYTITGLDNATRYYFRVAAVNKQGYEGTSAALDITPTYSGPVWWVATTGSDSNEGSSGSPFKSLEHAIDHVTAGDTVMLKKGTYTGSNNRDIEISNNNSTTNFDNFKNVVITSEKGADSTIIDAGGLGRHFTLGGDNTKTIDSTLQFIGLTFTGGKHSESGGSFYIGTSTYYDNSVNKNRSGLMQPKFKNCVFINNQTGGDNDGGQGGAFKISNAAPIFENCVFDSNYANGSGGAINVGGSSDAIRDTLWVRNCTFKNNYVNDAGVTNGGSATGGAITLDFGMNLIILNSLFEKNQAIQTAGNSGSSGGALMISDQWSGQINPYVWIANSRFTKNKVGHTGSNTNAHGGAIFGAAPFIMINTLIDSNSAEFSGSNGRGMGGGMMISMNSQWDNNGNEIKGHIYLINNTIADNYASSNDGSGLGGGINITNADKVHGTWFNNIFWGNRSNDASSTYNHNVIWDGGQQLQLNIDYNNIEFSEHVPNIMGSNSYDIDPSFYSATNYQLSTGSSLIGAGTASFDGTNAPQKDKLDNARPNPSGSSPDLGAYENALAESPYPKQLKNLAGIPGSGQVSLSWDANAETDIAKYVIHASTVKDFTPAREDSVGETTATVYNVTGLANNMEYHFRVAAVNSSGYRGSFSDQVSITPEYDGPIWWVDVSNGSDMNDGDENDPFASIQWAVTYLKDNNFQGDTIMLKPGVYNANNITMDNYDLHFRGSTGNYQDVIVDGSKSDRHFRMNNSVASFYDITFRNGSAAGDNSGGGSFYIANLSDVEFKNCFFYNNISHYDAANPGWSGGGAILLENPKRAVFRSCVFRNNLVENGQQGGAVYVWGGGYYEDGRPISHPEFYDCHFVKNGINVGNDLPEHYWLNGGAIFSSRAALTIEHSVFDSSFLVHNYGGQGEKASGSGAALFLEHGNLDASFDNVPFSMIRGNVIKNSMIRTTSGANGIAVYSRTKTFFENNLVYNNYATGELNTDQTGDGIHGGVYFDLTELKQDGKPAALRVINNTIVLNRITANNPNNSWIPGLHINYPNDVQDPDGIVGNNILTMNTVEGQTGDNNIDFGEWSNSSSVISQLFNNLIDKTANYGTDYVSGDPKFKNPSFGNFQLSNISPAVDAGAYSFPNGVNAPITDIRGYYRVGTPDIGAYEAGASKYLLAMADDITEDKDTTFVELSQELKITVTTGDLDGNLVSSNESMTWNIFPNQKYVKFISGDTDTEGGNASATFQVTDQDRGKGFRFRIEAGVGDAFMRSGIYVIEELVTGAPPPVSELTISPSDWTNQPNFNLNWQTPTWAAQRDLIGAVVEITDGVNVYNEYMGFPSGDTLTNYSFTAPEAGQYEAYLWLIDELGNEDKDSSMSVTAYFDDVAPEAFQIHSPESLEEIIYTSDKPRFYWEESGDYPSGIKEWRLFINNNLYGTYMVNDVTYDNGDVYIDAENALADGYYDWYLEAADHAENMTMSSDTGHFGVDLSPPNINHPGPLTQVDEGTTTPTINVSFSDGASGVKFGRLHYRSSGSGSGFVTIDLLGGPVSIPGSDVKAEGFEYYIDTEDNVGNYGYWPTDKALQSVRVRSEAPITTAQRWSNGIPGGTDSTNYLFFSIPFEVSGAKSAITSLMGPPDEFKYRLYAYNNGWQEDPSSVTMGNAYFFIFDPDKYTETPNLSFDFGQGVSTATDPPYQVNVTPGQWKFFGSPYNYNVPLDNVYTEDDENIRDAGSIYTWSGSWSNAGSSLQPWKGYVFKSGGATELNIDARGSGFGKMAKAMNTDDYPMDADEWIIDMIATTGNARDKLNAVGVRHMAEDGYDRLDEFEPPAVMGDITLRIDNRDREESPDLYAMDIRKPNEAGHYWDLQVFTPTNGGRTYLTFDGLGYIPEEYDIFLINKTTKQAKNLEWESSYRFANTGSESHLRQDLRLVVGTKQFVEDNNAGVNLYPDAFVLSQNYPNPFNPQTSIMISLEEDAQLNLIIFNLLGEEVTRLAMNEHRPAGYYTFIWNGTNAMGSKVSTGVYFYHAMIRDAQGKVVLNKTRKMIFLK